MDKDLLHIIQHFDSEGETFVVGKRNVIKLFRYEDMIVNVKSFKKPSLLFGFIYKFFRKSKAKRSYEYAKILEDKKIGTPKPIAYFENNSALVLKESYYISEHLVPDFIFRDLFDVYVEDLENILIQFTQFCFKLHESGIEFLDHSPGNTLIKMISPKKYEFFLVDLNRMNFHEMMDFKTRMKNLNRITPSKEWIKIISKEYARLYGRSENEVFTVLWKEVEKFQGKSKIKSVIKRAIKFK